MTKQVINIGVEGNDASGDSIRDAFKKANENFTELYAVFGQGGQISFTTLSDTPDTLGSNKIASSNADGTQLLMKTLQAGAGINVDTSNQDRITITTRLDIEVEIYSETDMVVEYCPFCGEENNALELDSDEYQDI